MKTLNLVNIENSDIKYKVSKFPDGQQTLDITNFNSIFPQDNLQIKSRMNSFKDLELIICATQALRNLNNKSDIYLYVPYFLGSRSDRKFQEGGINYLKQVICPIINSQNYSGVTVLDPHSDVLESLLNNFLKLSNVKLVDDALSHITKENEYDMITLISPDGGALKKIYDVAKSFDITNITTASKVRDIKTGKIVKTELPVMYLNGIKYIVIIDDICDGGRTFIEMAKEVKNQTSLPLHLIVTHGIFSAGFDELFKYFDGIYCTNSVKDFDDMDKLKQLNVF